VRRDPDVARVRDPLPVHDEHVGRMLKLAQRVDDDCALSEGQQSGDVGEGRRQAGGDALDHVQRRISQHDDRRLADVVFHADVDSADETQFVERQRCGRVDLRRQRALERDRLGGGQVPTVPFVDGDGHRALALDGGEPLGIDGDFFDFYLS